MTADLRTPLLSWYAAHARDLPWRRPGVGAWPVMMSEFMLQQTPVARVLPVYAAWAAQWPRPANLAAEPAGAAIRAWGRLGYPRRALRLHAAATVITERHSGQVPSTIGALRALPGVGDYTAAAIASFAFGQRHVVLDTNVRRVLSRVVVGTEFPSGSLTVAERRRAAGLMPADPSTAAQWAVAVMELGALVCTAAAPRCTDCPIADACQWRALGHPAYAGPPRRRQSYDGTDRQCRGRLLAVVRDRQGPAPRSALEAAWSDGVQRERALDGLVSDGLVEPLHDDRYALPRGTEVSPRSWPAPPAPRPGSRPWTCPRT
ncbi:MAG: A/G-specific adenine glycosylase [Nocardioidaceae bacterium]